MLSEPFCWSDSTGAGVFGTTLGSGFALGLGLETDGARGTCSFVPDEEASTTIRYGLPAASEVRLAVYDVLGRRVVRLVEGEASAGYHAVVWDGRSDAGAPVGSGLYVLRMQAGRFVETRTMLVVK